MARCMHYTVPMNMYLAAGIALCGNFLLSLGMILQKRHVNWVSKDKAVRLQYRGDRAGWICGFILMNLVPIFNYVALFGLSPNIVAALIGSSIAFTSLLTALILKEKIGGKRLIWTGMLFVSLTIAGLRGEPAGQKFSPLALFTFFSIPLIVGFFLRWKRKLGKRPVVAQLLAAVAGAMGGMMVLMMRAVQLSAGPWILTWFITIYFYTYFMAGASSFFFIQLAYKDGEMASVSPVFYGMQVLWPALASYAVFGSPFDPVEAAAFLAIALSIVFVSRTK